MSLIHTEEYCPHERIANRYRPVSHPGCIGEERGDRRIFVLPYRKRLTGPSDICSFVDQQRRCRGG